MAALWDDFDLAERLQLPVSWVAKRRRSGLIPCLGFGRYRRYDPESQDFKAWFDSLKQSRYYRAQSEKNGPEMEDRKMARSSYQRGRIEQRRGKYGLKWVLRYRIRSGNAWVEKTEELPVSGKATEKAARIAADKRMDVVNRMNNNRGELTMAAFLDRDWKAYVEGKNYKPETLAIYSRFIKKHVRPKLGDKILAQISPSDMTMFFSCVRAEIGKASIVTLYALLCLLFSIAVEADLIETTPIRPKLHKPIYESPEKPALNSEQLVKLICELEPYYQRLVSTLLLAALRVNEGLGLRWCDVDFESGALTVNHTLWRRKQLVEPKTRSSKRTVAMSELLKSILLTQRRESRHTAPCDFVFCKVDGNPLADTHLREHILYPAMDRAGIQRVKNQHGFHIFRHSAGTIIHRLTKDGFQSKEMLGHSDIKTTETYVHRDDELLRETAELFADELANCGLTVALAAATVH